MSAEAIDFPKDAGVTVVDDAGKHHLYAAGLGWITDDFGGLTVASADGAIIGAWTRGLWSRVEVTGSSVEVDA